MTCLLSFLAGCVVTTVVLGALVMYLGRDEDNEQRDEL